MSKHYSACEHYTISNHYRDKSNNVHQSYRTMMSEPSRSVLEIPRRSEATNIEKNRSAIEKMVVKFSILSYLLQIVPIIINYCAKKNRRKKYILDTILIHYLISFTILVLINKFVFVDCAVGGAPQVNELCKNFTQGNVDKGEFASPQYGHEYPEEITCFRTITADHGYFVRIDFRDRFNVEPPSNEGNCDYDYLEIRDGDQGYSPLIGMILYYNNKCILF